MNKLMNSTDKAFHMGERSMVIEREKHTVSATLPFTNALIKPTDEALYAGETTPLIKGLINSSDEALPAGGRNMAI